MTSGSIKSPIETRAHKFKARQSLWLCFLQPLLSEWKQIWSGERCGFNHSLTRKEIPGDRHTSRRVATIMDHEMPGE